MFSSGAGFLPQIVSRLDNAESEEAFQSALYALKKYLKEIEASAECLQEVERRAYYLSNDFSRKDTNERIEQAKKRVREYIDEWMNSSMEDRELVNILDNFYLFLEGLIEREPHKKGGIQKEQLELFKIKNEYDVQHLLFAYLRPLYPTVRAEVSEDTGYNTVRVDIFVDIKNVIEVKCTRKGMAQKKLIEEIEADMVHYNAESIYFFIYDKAKIIDNPLGFKNTYEKKITNKQIHIIIHQPKIL